MAQEIERAWDEAVPLLYIGSVVSEGLSDVVSSEQAAKDWESQPSGDVVGMCSR